MPDEPPSTDAGRQVGVADLQVDRVDVSTPRMSAAICVSVVHVPVPMSAAPICTE